MALSKNLFGPSQSAYTVRLPVCSFSLFFLQHMFVLLLFFTTLVGTATSEAAADGKLSAQFFTSAMLMEAVCSTNSTVEAGYALNQSSAPHIPCAPATTPAPAVIGARWDGHLVGLTPGKNYTFGVKTTGAVRFYVHGWKLVGAFQVLSIDIIK